MAARNSLSLKVLTAEVGKVQERLQRSSGNVVPWKEVQQRVAERNAASAPPWRGDERTSEPPDSGVRIPEPDNRGLSYTVYSVADLETRPRTSAPPPVNAPIPSRWPDVWRSTRALLRAWWAWVNTKPRPQMMDMCRVPLMTLQADLGAALRALPWKKIGIRAGIALGSILVLMFTVLAVAEFTDDLKPARTAANAIKIEAAPKAVEPVVAPAPPVAAEPALELEATPPPKKLIKKAAVGKKTNKKKGAETFVP